VNHALGYAPATAALIVFPPSCGRHLARGHNCVNFWVYLFKSRIPISIRLGLPEQAALHPVACADPEMRRSDPISILRFRAERPDQEACLSLGCPEAVGAEFVPEQDHERQSLPGQ